MTRAQESRIKRENKINENIEAEALKIFDWILNLFDADTEIDRFWDIVLFSYRGEDKIVLRDRKESYKLDIKASSKIKHNRAKLFTKLAKLINAEDGFKADLDLTGEHWDEIKGSVIVLQVVME